MNTIKIGEVCDILNGFAFKSGNYTEQGIRVLRITNVQKGLIVDDDPKYYPFDEETNLKQYMLKEGDLLMSLTGNVGRVGLLQKNLLPAALNQRVACLRIKNSNIQLEYIFHLLNSDCFERDCIFNATGIAQKNMSTEWLKKYNIPIPSLSEQQSIVAELDKINELISLKKAQLSDLDSLAQSIFYDMFGDPIENEKGWEVKKYGDCFTIGAGGTPSKSQKEYWENGNIPWIGSNMCQNCIIKETDGRFITEEGLNHSSAKLLDVDTVLVALVGATIGKVALLKTKTSTNQNVAFIKVNESDDFISEYVYFHLMNQYSEFLLIGNGDFKMANQAFIKSLSIMMPPLSLQQEFAKRIELIEQQKAQISSTIKDLETLLASRMQYWFD